MLKKNKLKTNFTIIINKIIEDKRLSAGAKGVACYLMSKPIGWQFYMSEISSNFKDSYNIISKYIKELEEIGFLKRIKKQTEKGTFIYDYELDYNYYNTSKEETTPHFSTNGKTTNGKTTNGKTTNGKTTNGNLIPNNNNNNNTDVTNTDVTNIDISLDKKNDTQKENDNLNIENTNTIDNVSQKNIKYTCLEEEKKLKELVFIENKELRFWISMWLNYKKQKKQPYLNVEQVKMLIEGILKECDNDIREVGNAVRFCIRNNYNGLFREKNKKEEVIF